MSEELWVVRAGEQAKYVSEFEANSYIAIGFHELASDDLSLTDEETVKGRVTSPAVARITRGITRDRCSGSAPSAVACLPAGAGSGGPPVPRRGAGGSPANTASGSPGSGSVAVRGGGGPEGGLEQAADQG